MDWQSPQFLYFILPLCVGWFALALYSDRRRQRAREAFVAQPMWSRVLPIPSRARFWNKLLLREIAIITGLISLAGPQFGTQLEQVVPRGSDLYVLVDVSRSMLADDVSPSRLERAKADVSALVNRLEGERIGLIAFAGQAVVKCPLTVDYDSFRRALNELDPNSAPRGGTAIGDAIRKAIEVFDAKAERDQAVLLITDGDDQESYPMEAAAIAAERKVTVFTVGLGDTEKGSRVPEKGAASFMEHEGQQVWSKLDGKLLQEIALKTSGIYIPAGTRAYDLGELYATHLQGRRGDDSKTQQRIRKSERFQIFLAIALFALLADLCISPYTTSTTLNASPVITSSNRKNIPTPTNTTTTSMLHLLMFTLFVTASSNNFALATDEYFKVREGLKLYAEEQYEAAGKEFAAAGEELEKLNSDKAAINVAVKVATIAYDEACAHHRKGDFEKARDNYLKAGLSQDRTLATAAHFNLGTLSGENARKLAGERPEEVAADKRQEILDELKKAIASYRHCLELQTDHAPSRRNLELVRNWIKYYTDRWREADRKKLRDESNLIAFLEFLMQTQSALRETVMQLPENVPADMFAEIKRSQDELREEVPVLREKISAELQPAELQNGGQSQPIPKEVQEGIALLQGWADKADQKMSDASRQLSKADRIQATSEQQAAVDELERIWDAVVPFHPLLAKELNDQTAIARKLIPEATSPAQNENAENQETKTQEEASANVSAETTKVESPNSTTPKQLLEINDEDFSTLTDSQSKTLRKARLLAPKAEAELSRVESQPATPLETVDPNAPQPSSPQPPVDPEKVKEGLQKAIELAPRVVEAMESAIEQLKKKDSMSAGTHAEEARRILEEIQKAQPKNEDQNKDQEKKDQQEKQDQKKDDKKQEDEKKPEEEKPKDKKSDDKKSDDEKENKDEKKDPNKQPKPQQVSKDRIEEALRKVRERQQEKQERDRETRMKVIGRAPVDKDW